VGAMPVRIRRIRLEGVRIGESRVGAVDGNAHAGELLSTRLTIPAGYA